MNLVQQRLLRIAMRPAPPANATPRHVPTAPERRAAPDDAQRERQRRQQLSAALNLFIKLRK